MTSKRDPPRTPHPGLSEGVPSPPGVDPVEWAAEQSQQQNPRIRALLGTSRLLEGVLESNQAILHCAPDRLREIWTTAREVARLILEEIEPLLAPESKVPRLEAARQRSQLALRVLYSTVIRQIQEMPEEVETERAKDFRRQLCISLGQLHDFIQNTFGDLMANDPRSLHDAGYFLSRRFSRDVEDAEWLFATVEGLEEYLGELEPLRISTLSEPLRELRASSHLPDRAGWAPTESFLSRVISDLNPKLKEVLALRGIRFGELEVLDRWSEELPTKCWVVLELWQLVQRCRSTADGVDATARHEQAARDRVLELLPDVDGLLKDLRAFLPIWRLGIGCRRALSFKGSE